MYEKIRLFCDDKGISVQQFESICGVSSGYVTKLKKSEPGVRTAKRMAEVMGITIEEFLKNDEQTKP